MGEGKDVSGTDRDEPARQHRPGGVRRRDDQDLSRQVAGRGRVLDAAEVDETLGGVRLMIGT